jgi:hypothetical protein
MRDYLKRLIEAASVGFGAGVVEYIATDGLDWSKAGLQGLVLAGLVGAYGVAVKYIGDTDRPTVTK